MNKAANARLPAARYDMMNSERDQPIMDGHTALDNRPTKPPPSAENNAIRSISRLIDNSVDFRHLQLTRVSPGLDRVEFAAAPASLLTASCTCVRCRRMKLMSALSSEE